MLMHTQHSKNAVSGTVIGLNLLMHTQHSKNAVFWHRNWTSSVNAYTTL